MIATKLRHASAALVLAAIACSYFPPAVAQGGDAGRGPGSGGGFPDLNQPPKACPPFRCSTGHSAVPKSRPKFESSGCSAMGLGIQASTTSGESLAMGPCCDRWHACYQICGSNRQQCDDAFKKCGEDACARIVDDDDAKKTCESTASFSSLMLRLGDCRKYDEAQRNACQCVASDKVGGYRKDAVRGFYKKYAPDALDEERVKMLAEKADTRAKMAGLFQKLVAKYPKCIKKVKDPKEAYMEEMMKKMDKGKKEKDAKERARDDSDETQEL